MGDGSDVHASVVDLDVERQRGHRSGASSSDATIAEGMADMDSMDSMPPQPEPDEPDDTLTELEEDEPPPTPRFLQDAGAWKHWTWVPYPMRRFGVAVARWTRGPADARAFVIKPLFPAIQHAPMRLLDRLLPPTQQPRSRRWRWGLYWGWLGLWLLTFSLVYRRGLAASEIGTWGTPGDIGCGNTYWVAGNQCGLDGSGCRPFDASGFAFRCPANCRGYAVLNPRAVGDQEIVYRPLVVGGPGSGPDGQSTVYRGDSFICGAAIHAGIINNAKGGCGVVRLVGRQSAYAASKHHGVSSIAFDSYFPLAFAFEDSIDCASSDMRWPLLAVSLFFSIVFSLFVASPAPFFFGVFTGLFWHVGMASDPPTHATTAGLFSNILGKFLPAMLTAWVIYDKMGVRRTLRGLTAQVEKTVLWLGGCWIASLNNYTFDHIPIVRLTPHDLEQQPGAKTALATILLLLLTVALSQVWFFRQEGRLRPHLLLYGALIGGLLFCMALPNLLLRIHHYIIGLLLLPGTSMQTRPSLLYQGLLVGFFINGIARWGWDSLLQTAAALQGDAQLGSPLPPLLEPAIHLANATAAAAAAAAGFGLLDVLNASSITFAWPRPPGARYDGISVLVNDVERYRGYVDDDVDGDGTRVRPFVWHRSADLAVNEYFRFAYMEGSQSDDYTKAGVWTAAGDWLAMAPGPSRVRSRSLDGEQLRR